MRGLFVPTFWPKKKMQSVFSKSSSVTVPTDTPMVSGRTTEVLSWHMLEESGRLLVPYIRANSRQVIGAIHPSEQAPDVGRLQRSPARVVEHDLTRIEGAQFLPDLLERFGPGDRDIGVRCSIPAHGMGEASCLFESVIAPRSQFSERMLGKELWRVTRIRQFPSRSLGAVLAILERMRLSGLGPCATDARKAVRLVLLQQHQIAADQAPLLRQNAFNRFDRAPAARRASIGLDLRLVALAACMAHHSALLSRCTACRTEL